jgi:hypothetical protein
MGEKPTKEKNETVEMTSWPTKMEDKKQVEENNTSRKCKEDRTIPQDSGLKKRLAYMLK